MNAVVYILLITWQIYRGKRDEAELRESYEKSRDYADERKAMYDAAIEDIGREIEELRDFRRRFEAAAIRKLAPNNCPECGSADIKALEFGIEGETEVDRKIECQQCEHIWYEVYTFSHIESPEE